MFLPVDNNGSDLLVHEDEDGAQQSWDEGHDSGPPRVWSQGADEPATVISGWLWEVMWSITYSYSEDRFMWKSTNENDTVLLYCNTTHFKLIRNL